MRVAGYGLVVERYVHGTVAGLAASVEVGAHVHVEHEVPHEYRLAPLVDGAQRNVLHVLHQSLRQVAAVIP